MKQIVVFLVVMLSGCQTANPLCVCEKTQEAFDRGAEWQMEHIKRLMKIQNVICVTVEGDTI